MGCYVLIFENEKLWNVPNLSGGDATAAGARPSRDPGVAVHQHRLALQPLPVHEVARRQDARSLEDADILVPRTAPPARPPARPTPQWSRCAANSTPTKLLFKTPQGGGEVPTDPAQYRTSLRGRLRTVPKDFSALHAETHTQTFGCRPPQDLLSYKKNNPEPDRFDPPQISSS